jgi:hypothetical protein
MTTIPQGFEQCELKDATHVVLPDGLRRLGYGSDSIEKVGEDSIRIVPFGGTITCINFSALGVIPVRSKWIGWVKSDDGSRMIRGGENCTCPFYFEISEAGELFVYHVTDSIIHLYEPASALRVANAMAEELGGWPSNEETNEAN